MKFIKQAFSYVMQAVPVILTFILLAFFIDYLKKSGVQQILINWISSKPAISIFLFLITSVLLYSIAFSGNMLAAIALVLFGFAKGSVLLIVSGILSSVLVFLAVRFLFHKSAQRWLQRRPLLRRIQESIAAEGIKFYCLIRFSPLHAAFITSLMAMSTMRFRDFIISLSMMLPQWLLFMYFAFLAAQSVQLAQSSCTLTTADVLRFVTLGLFIGVLVYVMQIAKRVVRQAQSTDLTV